ncbi:MAG: WYL domain-containing protein [Caedimonas sp.]|nr:WYL domain-containing protein [Caedimonas sp.]
MDHTVVKFLTRYQYQKSEEACPVEDKITLIQEAITCGKNLHIVYLKANDEKSTRMIKPYTVGEMMYSGKVYVGMEGYCHTRQGKRIFRVDRILDLKIAE